MGDSHLSAVPPHTLSSSLSLYLHVGSFFPQCPSLEWGPGWWLQYCWDILNPIQRWGCVLEPGLWHWLAIHWPASIFSALRLASCKTYARITSRTFLTDFRPPYTFPMLFYVSNNIPMLHRVSIQVPMPSIQVSNECIIFLTLCGRFGA